jgi:hypothetical protein
LYVDCDIVGSSMLTCIAIFVTAPSVLPLEVAHLVVCVEELTRSLSVESEVVHLMEELELGVSKALGVSLSEVHTRYFGDSDIGTDLVITEMQSRITISPVDT